MKIEQDTFLDVEGMSCPSCIRDIRTKLTALDGVRTVDVQLHDGIVRVKHDSLRAPVASLVAALTGAGYVAQPRGA